MRLIDADALERHVYTEWVNGELSNSEWVDFRQWLKDEPTVEPASPWHRVEEPPKESGRFLIGCFFDDGSFGWEAAEYDGTEWENDHGCYCGPDYWMPIEPPKEEN